MSHRTILCITTCLIVMLHSAYVQAAGPIRVTTSASGIPVLTLGTPGGLPNAPVAPLPNRPSSPGVHLACKPGLMTSTIESVDDPTVLFSGNPELAVHLSVTGSMTQAQCMSFNEDISLPGSPHNVCSAVAYTPGSLTCTLDCAVPRELAGRLCAAVATIMENNINLSNQKP